MPQAAALPAAADLPDLQGRRQIPGRCSRITKEGSVLGDAFKALADPSRRRILELLSEGDLSAGEIAAHFDMAKPSVSHHLSILRDAGLVTDERHGQSIIYHLNLTVLQELMKWFYDFGLFAGGDSNETEHH